MFARTGRVRQNGGRGVSRNGGGFTKVFLEIPHEAA